MLLAFVVQINGFGLALCTTNAFVFDVRARADQVQANDALKFFNKMCIVRTFERLDPMRLESMGRQMRATAEALVPK
ncbi:hypothetical protein [Candidatus Nitrotoga sp. 1052]|uniref:hypothetical protein n=1 Tax=Candidatus Nitrotoga sp. 1052 TaxID=2886964 RepID=UPI00403E0CC3